MAAAVRRVAAPLPLTKLPKLDAVLLSHDYHDHLDPAAIRFLSLMGVPAACIIELNWWESTQLSEDFTMVATPARHLSGRGLTRNNTLWASWCLLGPTHQVFFSGD